MTVSLTQPAIGSTNWGSSTNNNFQIIQDMLNGGLVNPIINGGFDYFQRTTPGTYTTVTDNKYGPDRWRSTRQTADIQTARFDGTGVSGLNSKYYCGYQQITAAGKFHISQWIENVDSVPRLNRTITLRVKLSASSSKTIRIAVLQLQSAGTADGIPSTLISAWNANGTNPTLATNAAIIGTETICSVTTSFTEFLCSVTAPSNSKNLAVAIWTDSQFSVNDALYIAECGLYNGTITEIPYWFPRPVQMEFALCQRFYEKTFDKDTQPANNIQTNAFFTNCANGGFNASYATACPFQITKRIAPTITFYNPRTSTAGTWAFYSAGAETDQTPVLEVNGLRSFSGVYSGNSAYTLVYIHYTAECEL